MRAAPGHTLPKSGELGVNEAQAQSQDEQADEGEERPAGPARQRRADDGGEGRAGRDHHGRGADEAPDDSALPHRFALLVPQQLDVELLELHRHARPGVARDGRDASLAAHARALGGPVEQVQERLGEAVGIVGRAHHQPLLPVLHEQLEARDAAGHDRAPRAHGLQQHHPEGGALTGRAVDVGRGVVARARPVDAAGPDHVVGHSLGELAAVDVAERPVADDAQPHRSLVLGMYLLKRLQHRRQSIAGVEAPEKQDEGLAAFAQLGQRLGLGREVPVVDAVRDDPVAGRGSTGRASRCRPRRRRHARRDGRASAAGSGRRRRAARRARRRSGRWRRPRRCSGWRAGRSRTCSGCRARAGARRPLRGA